MTRSHAFAMGYKIMFHDLNESEFGDEDIPAEDHKFRHVYLHGKSLAQVHKNQYEKLFDDYQWVDDNKAVTI